jgi:hypothetical protein
LLECVIISMNKNIIDEIEMAGLENVLKENNLIDKVINRGVKKCHLCFLHD